MCKCMVAGKTQSWNYECVKYKKGPTEDEAEQQAGLGGKGIEILFCR